LSTEKCLVVLFWAVFQKATTANKKKKHQKFLLMQGYFSKVKPVTPYSALT